MPGDQYLPPAPGHSADLPPVPGPHDPQPEPFDDSLMRSLHSQREEAMQQRDAHQQELAIQTDHHECEIGRLERVIAACTAALEQLDPPKMATGGSVDPLSEAARLQRTQEQQASIQQPGTHKQPGTHIRG